MKSDDGESLFPVGLRRPTATMASDDAHHGGEHVSSSDLFRRKRASTTRRRGSVMWAKGEFCRCFLHVPSHCECRGGSSRGSWFAVR